MVFSNGCLSEYRYIYSSHRAPLNVTPDACPAIPCDALISSCDRYMGVLFRNILLSCSGILFYTINIFIIHVRSTWYHIYIRTRHILAYLYLIVFILITTSMPGIQEPFGSCVTGMHELEMRTISKRSLNTLTVLTFPDRGISSYPPGISYLTVVRVVYLLIVLSAYNVLISSGR